MAHLAWDDCGAAGIPTKTFACDANSGLEQLVLSFVPAEGITAFYMMEVIVQPVWWETNETFPQWWQLCSLEPGCRAGSLRGRMEFELASPAASRIGTSRTRSA